jgi:probable rRNA maturation factor
MNSPLQPARRGEPGRSCTLLFRRAGPGLDRALVRRWAGRIAGEVAPGRALLCLITDDTELARLNRDFLGHDYPTDVLSFPAPAPDGGLGELAISAGRARAQAAEHGHAVETELAVLLLHGLLHLLGHDHATDRGRMRRLETRWRRTLGLPGGLIERSRRP